MTRPTLHLGVALRRAVVAAGFIAVGASGVYAQQTTTQDTTKKKPATKTVPPPATKTVSPPVTKTVSPPVTKMASPPATKTVTSPPAPTKAAAPQTQTKKVTPPPAPTKTAAPATKTVTPPPPQTRSVATATKAVAPPVGLLDRILIFLHLREPAPTAAALAKKTVTPPPAQTKAPQTKTVIPPAPTKVAASQTKTVTPPSAPTKTAAPVTKPVTPPPSQTKAAAPQTKAPAPQTKTTTPPPAQTKGALATATKGAAPASPGGAGSRTLNVVTSDTAFAKPLVIMREVYTYDPAGRRDPFLSLLTTSDLRPTLSDLKLMGIIVDEPGRSVALLQDNNAKKQLSVRVGTKLGRMRVTSIGANVVVFTIDEFGTTRRDSIQLRDMTKVRGR